MPSAVSERFSELIGCPISWSLATSCICLELRPLPSAGITQPHQYYGPLRHPKAPSLTFTGIRLVIPITTPRGFPCCVRFPCVHAVATTPAQRLGYCIALPPSRINLPQNGCWVGLRNVLFEACSAFTHVTACTLALSPNFATRFTEGFNHFVASTVAPVASGWSGCRVGLSPTGKTPPFHGARHKQTEGRPLHTDRSC